MRGAPASRGFPHGCPGIIPAYAGSTSWVSIGQSEREDHPRVCGEHIYMRSKVPSSLGSSPRMRGALAVPVDHMQVPGIIPAYAGST